MAEPKRARGRPRTQEVIDRDELIFQAIAGSDRAVTKYEIAAGTGVPAVKVYTSLRRLSLAKRISRVYIVSKQHFWSNRRIVKPVVELAPVDEQPAFIPAAVFSSPE
jgi:hypothetical protein